MVRQSFSIPEHIPKIKSGEKSQATIKGIREIPMGTKLQQYYRPRMKKGTCENCICDCGNKIHYEGFAGCSEWDNYFGEVLVTSVRSYPLGMQELREIEFDGWAICDGFSDGNEAEEWFTGQYGIGWKQIPMTVIKWDNSKRVMK